MSIYEHERKARDQGFGFAVKQILPRWPQFGYVIWSTEEAAVAEGSQDVASGRCSAFEVCRIPLLSVSGVAS